MLARSTNQQELVAGLAEAFAISPERAERDVQAFLGRLAELGLLLRDDG